MDVSAYPGSEALEALGIRPRPASEFIAAHTGRGTAG
jgi:hypothetical protein